MLLCSSYGHNVLDDQCLLRQDLRTKESKIKVNAVHAKIKMRWMRVDCKKKAKTIKTLLPSFQFAHFHTLVRTEPFTNQLLGVCVSARVATVCMCRCVRLEVCVCVSCGCSAPGTSSFTHMVNIPEGAKSCRFSSVDTHTLTV